MVDKKDFTEENEKKETAMERWQKEHPKLKDRKDRKTIHIPVEGVIGIPNYPN